jgi:hypothetical protein
MICFPLDNTEYGANALGAWCGTRTRGVFAAEEHYAVTANGDMTVTVSPGLAWLKADTYWGVNAFESSPQVLTLDTADGSLDRIDAVCLRLDKNQNLGEIVIKKGSYLQQPPVVVPPVRDLDYDEIYVATVLVRAGTTSVLTSDITDQRLNEDYCGLMRDGITRVRINEITGDTATNIVGVLKGDGSTVSGITGVAELGSDSKLLPEQTPDPPALGNGYGTCTTAAATAAKVVTLAGFVRKTGSVVGVKFSIANTAANPTLNVNNTGASPTYDYMTNAYPVASAIGTGTHYFQWNGSQWVLLNPLTFCKYYETTCSTAARTTAKVTATISGFARSIGAIIKVTFTYANTATSPTLNVNSTGAAAIYDYRTGTYPITGAMWAGTHFFIYTGSAWLLLNPVLGGAYSETGTYIGTGVAGPGNSNSLTFGFVPKFVQVWYAGPSSNNPQWSASGWPAYYAVFVPISGTNTATNVTFLYGGGSGTSVGLSATWSNGNKTVSWFITNTSISGSMQLNGNNDVYRYLAIG